MKKIILALSLVIVTSASADQLVGKVVGISDGDTITILDKDNNQYKIRLAGIDAPEKKQAFGNVSKKSLSDLIYDQEVTVESNKKDQYGRFIGKILLANKDINKIQIEKGMAWFYKKYQNELILEDRLSYLNAEINAKNKSVGLWVDKDPIPPWEFRKNK